MTAVLAVGVGDPSPSAAVDSLRLQLQPGDQIVVVAAAPIDVVGADSVVVRPGALVPVLWSAGIAAASTDVVALLSAPMVPADNWLATIRSLFSDGELSAAGGIVCPADGLVPNEWAYFLARYHAFMPGQTARDETSLAADNAAYRRASLEPHKSLWIDGFWEPRVHAAMADDGALLRLEPTMTVTMTGAPPLRAFLRQRIAHGLVHGAHWAAGKSLLARAAHVVAAPLVPLVLLRRSAVQAQALPAARQAFPHPARQEPYAVIHSAWTLGEVIGRIRPSVDDD